MSTGDRFQSGSESGLSSPRETSLGLESTIPRAHWADVVRHLESAERSAYWLIVDRRWEITAASASFQLEILQEREDWTQNFLETLPPGGAEELCRRAEEDRFGREEVELLHPVRSGARSVRYRLLPAGDGWILFGQDQSHQLELVAQMSALIEDLDAQMQRERALARRLQALLSSDYLTGLASRQHVEDVLESCWQSYVASGKSFAVMVVDIDEFPGINDRFGHDVGDAVLKRVAEAIEASIRAGDVAGRYGGEEFVVIAAPNDSGDALKIGERIRSRVQVASMPDGVGQVTVSVGVAATDPHAPESPEELLKWGSMALCRARRWGGNRVECLPADAAPFEPEDPRSPIAP